MVGHTYIDDFKTLPEMLVHTLQTKPEKEGYRYYDYEQEKWTSVSWREFGERVMKWRKALAAMNFNRGDRVAMLLINSLDALTFDQAALANALVPVPLHAIDTPESAAYIMSDSGCRFLVTTTKARWNAIFNSDTPVPTLEQVVFTTEEEEGVSGKTRYCGVNKWLEAGKDVKESELPEGPAEDDLAAIVYTSGTTGRPKGVMLTHKAVLSNVQDIAKQMPLDDDDLFLSYLPLSHTFERTATYYNCVAHGATLVFSRGPMQLAEDFKDIHPTLMCSVPRILEQFYAKIQAKYAREGASAQEMADRVVAAGWRDFCRENDLPLENDGLPEMDAVIKALYFDQVAQPVRELFGPRFKYIVSGGAALNGMVAKFFCAMGLNIRQAYGLTEYSPVISMNGMTGNHPATVGLPLAAQKFDRPRRNRIFGISRQHRRQRTLARPVGPHYGMHLALTHLEVYAPKYLLALNRGVQILYTQHIFFVSLSLFLHFHFSDCRYLHAVHSSKLLPCRIHTTCRHA